tara:strand:+ start:2794 stop:4491 length:1698 start_codon:yes stop_codon:yes gene_type:complete
VNNFLFNKFRFSNISLTSQIIIINLIVIITSFIFFGIFNFYIISKDFNLKDSQLKLDNLSDELVKYLVKDAIKKPLYTADLKQIGEEPLDPNTSRIIKKSQLISSNKEALDPYTLQVIIDSYYKDINTNIKIYNTKNFVLFDSESNIYKKDSIIKTSDIEKIVKQNFLDNYKTYYINNFIYLWRLYSNNKYKNYFVAEFNEIPKIVEIIKNQKSQEFFYIDDDKSINIKIMKPIIKNEDIFGVAILTDSLRNVDQVMAELSFNLFNNLIVLILFVILIAVIYARSIVKPIKRLSDITNQYSLNNSINSINYSFPKRGDEIGQLSDNLKLMSKELLNRINELERFAADVSHELKNPLTSIRSANDILQKGNKNPETNKELLSIIDKDTNRMNRLITDILNYTKSKVEADKLDKENIKIINLIRDMINNYSQNNKNINFKSKFSNNNNYLINANYEKIAQVISIIFDNAISFSPKNSSIFIYTRKFNKKIIIYVVDQGTGINKEYSEKIFERFYTDREENNDKHSGLGLDIARHIVTSYRGRIYLRKQKIKSYKGACFIVELPLKEV